MSAFVGVDGIECRRFSLHPDFRPKPERLDRPDPQHIFQ
jgi:hypothetical protein